MSESQAAWGHNDYRCPLNRNNKHNIAKYFNGDAQLIFTLKPTLLFQTYVFVKQNTIIVILFSFFFSFADLAEKAQVADFETAVHYAGNYHYLLLSETYRNCCYSQLFQKKILLPIRSTRQTIRSAEPP